MKSTRIPTNDTAGHLTVSQVGFGCAGLMRLPSGRARRDLVAAVLDTGVTHFDVARMYGLGAAEAQLGKCLRGRRDAVTIATKFGIGLSPLAERLAPLQGPARALIARSRRTRSTARAHGEAVVAARWYDASLAETSLDRSLRELGVDYVDILFLHDPRPHDGIEVEALSEFLATARDKGKLRSWGISIDSPAGLDVLGRFGGPGVLQLREDPLHPTPPHRTAIAFGVMQWLEPIRTFLSADPTARKRWADTVDCDPLEADHLAALLLGAALARADVGAVLYSTTQSQRLAAITQFESAQQSWQQPPGIAACIEHDRGHILRLAAG